MVRKTLSLLSLFGLVCALPLACKPQAPKTFPDRASVEKAHVKWCAMIDKHRGKGVATYKKDCEGFYPGASAPYLEKMVGCYDKLLTEYGDDAPDSQVLLENCTQEVLNGVDPGDVSGTPVVKARCARMNRCQQVSVKACNDSFNQVDGMSRALLTNRFNLRAQQKVAACLDETPCGDKEERVENDCYRPVRDKMVWLPIHLGPDPGLAPDPS